MKFPPSRQRRVPAACAYAYDANGNRTEKRLGTDSLAETPMQASYDVGNRLTRIVLHPGTPNEKTYDLAYDEEGNLTAKTNAADAADRTAYTWSARNQLTAISSPGVQASFQYDALGRRTAKTVNGDTVHYLYDGQQAIAELRNGAVSAAYHPGIVLDEVLARYTSQGERSLLQDALNSVIAQTDGNQTATNWRAYSPYGETQSLGPDENNPLQYTGRENDRTGLYYYRARYYDPVLKRFISEDPIGLNGGINLYSYVDGDPITNVDPSGEKAEPGDSRVYPPTMNCPAYNACMKTYAGRVCRYIIKMGRGSNLTQWFAYYACVQAKSIYCTQKTWCECSGGKK